MDLKKYKEMIHQSNLRNTVGKTIQENGFESSIELLCEYGRINELVGKLKYGLTRSDVWRAIEDRIMYEEHGDPALIVIPRNYEGEMLCRMYYRGGSPVGLDDITLPTFASYDRSKEGADAVPDFIVYQFHVDFDDEESHEGVKVERYYLEVPLELEVNFSKERFEEWVDDMRKTYNERITKDADYALRTWMRQNAGVEDLPKYAKIVKLINEEHRKD